MLALVTKDMSDKFRMFDILDVDMGGASGNAPAVNVHSSLTCSSLLCYQLAGLSLGLSNLRAAS